MNNEEDEGRKLKDNKSGDGDTHRIGDSSRTLVVDKKKRRIRHKFPPYSPNKIKATLEQLSNDRGGIPSSSVSTAVNYLAKDRENRCTDVRVPKEFHDDATIKRTTFIPNRITFIPGTGTSKIPKKENESNDTFDITVDLTPAQKVKWKNLPPPIWDDINRAKKEWRTFLLRDQDWGYIPPSLDAIDKTEVHRLGTAGMHFAIGNEGLIKMICQFGPKHTPTLPTDTSVSNTNENNNNNKNNGRKKLRKSKSKTHKRKKLALNTNTESSTSIVCSSEVHALPNNHQLNSLETTGGKYAVGLNIVNGIDETNNKVNKIVDSDMRSIIHYHNSKPNSFENNKGGSVVGHTKGNGADETKDEANEITDSDMKPKIDSEQYYNAAYSVFNDPHLNFEAAATVSSPSGSFFGRYDDKTSTGPDLNNSSNGKTRQRSFEVTIKAGPKIHHSQTLIYGGSTNLYDINVYDAIQQAYRMQKERLVFMHDKARKGKLIHLKYTNVSENSVGIISSNRWSEINLGELRDVVQKNAILLEVELVDTSEF